MGIYFFSRSMSPEQTASLHLKALATTFNNYVNSPEKQRDLPENSPKTAVTKKDIENMHMRALA